MTSTAITAAPTITSFTPANGPVGTSVVITGTNFTGATAVKFNGTDATAFTVNSATQITATVPAGATTGTISVATPSGTGTSSTNFTVTAASAGTPSVTNATTDEDIQSSTGLVVTQNATSGDATAFYKITGITNGTLFKSTGTQINNGDFITLAEGAAGLKFTPGANLNSLGTAFSFQVQASTSNAEGGLGGSAVTASITVNAINDAPAFNAVSNVTVNEDSGAFTQSNFVTGVVPGPVTATDESAQTVSLSATNTNNSLFSTQPSVAADGTLTFTPAANASGTATVTVTATDSGSGTAPNVNTFSRTFTITVNPVNDAPTLSATAANPTFTEDGAPAALFGSAAVSTVESGQNIDTLVMTISGLADLSEEFLRIDGSDVEVTFNSTVTTATNGLTVSVVTNAAQDAATVTITKTGGFSAAVATALVNGLTYHNASNNPTVGARVVTFTSIKDDGGTANSGADTTALSVASTVTVAAVNDAPVLEGVFNFDPINEDDTANNGASLATLLAEQIRDPDGPGRGVAVVATVTANGSWEYSTDGGSTWLPIGAVSDTSALLLLTDNSVRVRFVPNADFNGTVSNGITFRAWDASTGTAGSKVDTTTNGGTSAFSTETASASIVVNAVNDAPVNAVPGSPVAVLTGGTVAVTGISVADVDAAGGSISVVVSAPAGSGTFAATDGGGVTVTNSGTSAILLTGTATAVNAFIAGGALSYAAPATAGNVTAAVLSNDGGNTGSGGALTDTDTFTITVSDPVLTPTVTNATTNEDTQTSSGLVITANPLDGGTTTHYQITGISNGALFLADGFTPVADGAFITVAQGAAGLKFTPDANEFGSSGFGFNVQASTSGGTAGLSGGVVPATITVNPVNDAPTIGAVANQTIDEDGTTGALSFTADDVETSAAALTVTATSSNQALVPDANIVLGGSGANRTVTVTPAADQFGGPVTITLTVSDGTGSSFTTFTVTINAVNDGPTFTASNPPASDEDAGAQTVGGFVTTFSPGPANESGQTATGYTVTVTGTTGNLAFTDAPAIDAGGTLTYTAAPDTNGTATIEVTVADSGGATSAPQTFTITVNAVNDAPVLTLAGNVTATASPDTPGPGLGGTYTQPNFASLAPGGGTDENSQSAAAYTVTYDHPEMFVAFPAINGNGTLSFTLVNGATGVVTVTVTGQDTGGTANGGNDTSAPKTFTITVAAAPVVEPPDVGDQSSAASAQFIAIGTDAGALGVVRVLGAATRAPVRDIVPFAGYFGGVKVALGDVNGDGKDDLIVGSATQTAHVKVFDIATGTELRSFLPFPGFTGGIDVAAGDINGDGKADVIVGAATQTSHVKAFSGATGAELLSFLSFPGFTGGVKVAAGDVTGDGRADVAVLAGPGGNGHIKVFDGTNGAVVTSFLGYVGYLGEIDLAVGDVDGNGVAEVVTAAQNPTSGTHVKAFNQGAATVRSFFAPTSAGETFQRSDQFPVPIPGTTARLAVADLDGDRFADYLLGSQPSAGASRMLLLSGATGATMDNRFALDPIYGLGIFIG